MKTITIPLLLGLGIQLLFTHSVHAWGRRGHSIVCENAAYLLTMKNKEKHYIRSHSFDLGYYCNSPDIIWKRPATYNLEKYNHYHDVEIFKRNMPKKDFKDLKSFELGRKEFNKKYDKVPEKAGRAWWRIRELFKTAEGIKTKWSKSEDPREKKAHQLKWLSTMGIMGHYIGDLSVPMHVTENYDGQLTGNKGIHSFFEEILVDYVYQSESLQNKAYNIAKKKWPEFQKEVKGLSLTQLLDRQSKESLEVLKTVLKIDTKKGRKSLDIASKAHLLTITNQLAHGSLYYAEYLRRQYDFAFDDNRFFSFDETPEYIDANK